MGIASSASRPSRIAPHPGWPAEQHYRRTVAGAFVLLLIALSLTTSHSNAAEAGREILFERAEFVLSDDRRPPSDAAAWQPVSLPHEWRRTHPGVTGQGWYRITFELEQVPRAIRAIMLFFERSHEADFFVNGNLIGGSRDLVGLASLGGGYSNSVFLLVPPSVLSAGANTAHVRIRTAYHPVNLQGLGRVTFGEPRSVRRAFFYQMERHVFAERAFAGMAFAAGLITLFVWFARRTDPVMLWFSITCLTWSLATTLKYWLRWIDMLPIVFPLTAYSTWGLVVPAVILCLRTVGLRWLRFEAALWAFLILEVTYPLWWDLNDIRIRQVLHIVNSALLLTGVAIILETAPKPLRWAYRIEVAALTLMAVLMSLEVARYLGWIDIESTVLRLYHIPVMLLAIGAAIFERHVLAVWRTEQANVRLERRVQEKAREIEAYHAEREEVMRQQALAGERHRILTDMHDGLGASLVGLLRYVQSKPDDARGIEQRVKEALQEMRIAIDALEPAEGDLAVVLGKLRFRLTPMMEAAGVHLAWDVAELPSVEALDPSAVFAVQRAVLEALSNALNHSAARHIQLVAEPTKECIEIRIEDDGKGFRPDDATSGLGLSNMRARIEGLGGRFAISSHVGGGTCVMFTIPYTVATQPAAEVRTMMVPADGVTPASLAPT